MVVAAEASDAVSMIRQAIKCEPQVILLDWELPCLRELTDGTSPSPAEIIKSHCPGAVIIAMSISFDSGGKAMKSGVDEFVSKTEAPTRLLEILNSIKSRTEV